MTKPEGPEPPLPERIRLPLRIASVVIGYVIYRVVGEPIVGAFLIYLDPQHGTNSVRTLIVAQMMAALIGLVTFTVFGGGYISGGSAMVATIIGMVLLDPTPEPDVQLDRRCRHGGRPGRLR